MGCYHHRHHLHLHLHHIHTTVQHSTMIRPVRTRLLRSLLSRQQAKQSYLRSSPPSTSSAVNSRSSPSSSSSTSSSTLPFGSFFHFGQQRRGIASAAEAISYHPFAAQKAQQAQESQTARAERQLKRFWKDASVVQDPDSSTGEWNILLDKRTLKTPSGKRLVLPKEKHTAALAIAYEWDSQDGILKPHSLPVTSLASRALDGLSDPSTRSQVLDVLLRYLHTDTVIFQEEGKTPALTKLQDAHWKPLIEWVNKRFNTKVVVSAGQLFNRQPKEVADALSKVVQEYDAFHLAGFERAVMASKSYIIALALAEGQITADEAAQASHVEVQSQIDRWGEVEDTHDVDHQDIRVRLGSAAILMSPFKSSR